MQIQQETLMRVIIIGTIYFCYWLISDDDTKSSKSTEIPQVKEVEINHNHDGVQKYSTTAVQKGSDEVGKVLEWYDHSCEVNFIGGCDQPVDQSIA